MSAFGTRVFLPLLCGAMLCTPSHAQFSVFLNNLLNGDSAKGPDYDTAYIASYRDDLVISPIMAHQSSTVSLSRTDNEELDLSTNSPVQYGLALDYKWLGIEYTASIPGMSSVDEARGPTESRGLGFGYTGRSWWFRNAFRYSKGFHVEDPTLVDPDWTEQDPYPQRADMETVTYMATLSHGFNTQRYSHTAALWQMERQKRSAGSWVVGGTFWFARTTVDSSLIPVYQRELYYAPPTVISVRRWVVGITGGYTHTFSLRGRGFVNLMLVPGVGAQQQLLGSSDGRSLNVGWSPAVTAETRLGAWLLVALYYFYQYALRSCPSVMMPQLQDAFAANALGVSAIVGLFYYGYSPFSLVAGAALDRFGSRRIVPIGALLVGTGALLFSTGDPTIASIGRFIQGAGGVFALVGAVYLVTRNFPASVAASFVGATQMFGMAGGSAGQFVVGPLIQGGLAWDRFWLIAGLLGLAIGVCLFLFLPKDAPAAPKAGGLKAVFTSLGRVFANRHSILSGFISGLLFLPTTIFSMTWGVKFLEEAYGRDYEQAVMMAATVPLGWMIGCPLMGYISDRIGRRKPVIFAGALVLLVMFGWVLFGDPAILRGPVVGILMGIASGAAMLPYTVIKEVNPPELGGSATGVVNFLNFTFSAVMGPIFGRRILEAAHGGEALTLLEYREVFKPLLAGIVIAVVLTLLLKETGRKAIRPDGPGPAAPERG